jgi:NAD(P)-dependent dehydrogenase (short-subunit alcohol dehydrogenase family)
MTPFGHAALVTGGASGLGLATAQALIAAGAKVTLLDVDAARLAEAGAAIGALAVVCDVTRAEDAEAAVAQAAAAHGAARILINCAGIGPAARVVSRSGPMALDAFRRVIEINLIGSFNLLRLFAAGAQALEALEGGERGVAINTASVAAYDGQIGQAAYSASKGGVVAMTLPIARELASTGIRVCTIAPGLFETPMLMGMPQAVRDSLGASVPFPARLGRGEEYAHLALHIIQNIMLNGETIRLDGALRMAPR